MTRFSQSRFVLSVASLAQFPPDRGAEVAFAGRSNAGKSSAINAILARRSLARTGKTPGQTRLLNYFEVGPERRIVDLPGYGFARVPDRARLDWGPLLERLRERRSLCGLFLIVDVRRGIGELDLALIDWAMNRERLELPDSPRVHVLLAKADKLNRGEASRALRAAEAVLAACGHGGDRLSVQLFSSIHPEGLAEAQRVLAAWLGLDAAGRPEAERPSGRT